jgi:hypothetical protein
MVEGRFISRLAKADLVEEGARRDIRKPLILPLAGL